MSEVEFKQLNHKFIEAIKERCNKEGLRFGVQQQLGSLIVIIGNEAYRLNNDGNTASWNFAGMVQ